MKITYSFLEYYACWTGYTRFYRIFGENDIIVTPENIEEVVRKFLDPRVLYDAHFGGLEYTVQRAKMHLLWFFYQIGYKLNALDSQWCRDLERVRHTRDFAELVRIFSTALPPEAFDLNF